MPNFIIDNIWVISSIVIALISLGVSMWAITVSKQAHKLAETKFKRDKEIEKPILFNHHIGNGNRFVAVIRDYSANKNLRIDKIETKLPEDDNYIEIPFETKRNDSINPPQVTVITNDSFNVLDGYNFKIYTNFGDVLECNRSSLLSEKNPDD